MTAAIHCVASVESTESPMLVPTRGLTRILHATSAKPKSKSRMPGAVRFAKPGNHRKHLAKESIPVQRDVQLLRRMQNQ
eukprot:6330249-Karenia_brevis.AAC.1